MTFGQRMTLARKEKGLTQKALAETMKVSPMRISHYEADSRQPDIESIKTISRILGVSPDWLLGIVEEKTAIDDSGLKEIDYEILRLFSGMSDAEQKQWIAYATLAAQIAVKDAQLAASDERLHEANSIGMSSLNLSERQQQLYLAAIAEPPEPEPRASTPKKRGLLSRIRDRLKST